MKYDMMKLKYYIYYNKSRVINIIVSRTIHVLIKNKLYFCKVKASLEHKRAKLHINQRFLAP